MTDKVDSSSRSQPVLSPESDNDAPCYLLMKRGLYYRPNSMGYTGIKDNAGLYTRAEAEDHADPISGVSFVHWSEAGEVAPKAFNDTAVEHLLGKLARTQRALDEALARCVQPRAAWTHVEDELPGEQGQDSGNVLVFINGHCALTDMKCRQGGAWGLNLGWYDADRGYFRVHGRPASDVTHWMPTPDAPVIQSPATSVDGAERVHEGGLRDALKSPPTQTKD